MWPMQIIRWIVGACVFVALLFLSLQNAETVSLRFFNLASWQAPLAVVVLVTFAAGVAAGLLAGAMRAVRLKRQLNRLRREHQRDDDGAVDGASASPATGLAVSRRERASGSG